jgi:hypothetical protein
MIINLHRITKIVNSVFVSSIDPGGINMTTDFIGKTALVTGAARGIG